MELKKEERLLFVRGAVSGKSDTLFDDPPPPSTGQIFIQIKIYKKVGSNHFYKYFWDTITIIYLRKKIILKIEISPKKCDWQ